ncbi:MAG TPA: hypothetical protein VFK50_02310 [Sphingomicrobium sp.]|nr:hypothetical protein [Sphingomicrobium sp.]
MTDETARAGRLSRDGGIALIAGAIASIILMMNHPSGAHGGPAGSIVHGGMMLALSAMLFGFIAFVMGRGVRTPLILGLIAATVSLAAHIAAATINGFTVPVMAAWPSGAPGHDVFLLAWLLNQALAGIGVFATGIAYLCWAFDLRRDQPFLAAAGALAGIIPAALLATGAIKLDVHGALLAYGLHGLWAVVLGVWMIRSSRT